MPTCRRHHDHAQERQQKAIRQDDAFVVTQAIAPVHAEKRKEQDCKDEMRPSRRPGADAGYEQQFSGSGDSCDDAEQEASSRRPYASARPEGVACPPVKEIRSEQCEGERDREGDRHGVDRMAKNGYARFGLVKLRKMRDRIEEADFLSSGHGRSSWRYLAFLTLSTVSGCEGRLSTVDPASRTAEHIATLWWVLLAGSIAIFALVMGLLLRAFQRTPIGIQDERRQERVWIYGLGLAFPLAVLAGLLAYGLTIGEKLLPGKGQNVVTVRAEARQWSWSFRYADAPGHQTQDILHIPAGRPVDIEITSADVIHSFWSPRLAGKLDAIPGQVNVLRIEAAKPGEYRGASAEFSGEGYSGDAFFVIAHDTASWDAFLRRARQ